MDRNILNHVKAQASILYLLLQLCNALPAPHFAYRNIVKAVTMDCMPESGGYSPVLPCRLPHTI